MCNPLNFLAPVIDLGTAIFAPEALPFVAPAVGALQGGLEGGPKGALIGGLEGGVAGQLGGTGEFAPLSSGGQSFLQNTFQGVSDFLTGAGTAADTAATGAAGTAAGGVESSALSDAIAGGYLPTQLGASGGQAGIGAGTTGFTPTGLAAPPVIGGVGAAGQPLGGGAAFTPDVTLNPASASAIAAGTGAVPANVGVGDATKEAALAATGGAPVGGGGAGGGGGGGNTFANFAKHPGLGTFGDILAKNPGLALNAGVLGYEALKGQPKLPQQDALQQQADQLRAQGAGLTAALSTGKLPAGAQSAIDEAVNANIANIRSQYASMGLSGSTMEGQAIAEARNRGVQMQFQVAQQLAQTGLQETTTSSDILKTLMDAQLQSDSELTTAIADFARAAGGGGPTINIGRGP